MVVFDPYLSSRPLANALMRAPEGRLIAEGFYYQFSSVFFYTNRTGLLLATRKANLEYGANAPDAAEVFIDDSQLKRLWMAPGRKYLLTFASAVPRYQELVAPGKLMTVAESGGKVLLTNHPLDEGAVPESRPAQSTGSPIASLQGKVASVARKTCRADLHPIDILAGLTL